jgi:hypothetical protein
MSAGGSAGLTEPIPPLWTGGVPQRRKEFRMTNTSQFDPLADAPRSYRERLARKFGRTVEPMAIQLLAWCRSLDHRVSGLEARSDGVQAKADALAHSVRALEARTEAMDARLDEGLQRYEGMPQRVRSLEGRTDQLFWGREALVERMNVFDAIADRVAAVEDKAETLHWGREALVERMNRDDAVFDAFKTKVEEQSSLPLAFGLDYLAMGRRIAMLEDQVEALLAQLARSQGGLPEASVVAFPATPEKAAG